MHIMDSISYTFTIFAFIAFNINIVSFGQHWTERKRGREEEEERGRKKEEEEEKKKRKKEK